MLTAQLRPHPTHARVPDMELLSPTFRAPRQRTRRLGRLIYLSLVLAFAWYVTSTLIGQLVILDASGLVTSNRFVVGAAYTARVVNANVAPGQKVRPGDVIATLESSDVLTSIAQLAQNIAVIEARQQAIVKQRRVVENLIPVAERRLQTAQEGETKLSHDPTGGYTSQVYKVSVLTEAYDAERDLATLRTDADSAGTELSTVDTNLDEIRAAMDKMRQSYADGVVKAPVDGTVSAAVAAPGQVLTAGQPVMEILTGSPYVLAYLPNGRLYDVSPGERVVLTDGVHTVDAHVERIDMVADNLPSEFRTTFGIHERQQVMRVVPDEPMPFPYLSRVSVISPWSLAHMLASLKGFAADFANR
jgi:multidrug resistance efflux pump